MVEVPPMIAERQKQRTAGTAGTHASPKIRRTTGSAPASSRAAAGYSTVVTRFSARAVASANRCGSARRLGSAGKNKRAPEVEARNGRKGGGGGPVREARGGTPATGGGEGRAPPAPPPPP